MTEEMTEAKERLDAEREKKADFPCKRPEEATATAAWAWRATDAALRTLR